MRADDANCPAKLPWTTGPSLVFPSAFLNRRVEGWAIVAFDVAPWGDVGNLRVLASEPAADFGTQAVALLRNGKKASGGQGHTGCVEKVRFAVSRNDMASAGNHRVAAD